MVQSLHRPPTAAELAAANVRPLDAPIPPRHKQPGTNAQPASEQQSQLLPDRGAQMSTGSVDTAMHSQPNGHQAGGVDEVAMADDTAAGRNVDEISHPQADESAPAHVDESSDGQEGAASAAEQEGGSEKDDTSDLDAASQNGQVSAAIILHRAAHAAY